MESLPVAERYRLSDDGRPAVTAKPTKSRRPKKRLVRRLQLAESVCQEVRFQTTSRVVDQDWSGVFKLLLKWMRSAPQEVRYSRPPNAAVSDGGTPFAPRPGSERNS